MDDGASVGRLVGTSGLDAYSDACPHVIDTSADSPGGWPIGQAIRDRKLQVLADLPARFGSLPGGPYPEPTHTAVVVPLAKPGQDPYAMLIAGVSPRRAFDDPYHGFFEMAADHILSAITNARAFEEERKRAEALAEIDRAKIQFFSNVSHEFRTPLTLMLGPLEETLHRSETLTPADRSELATVQRNAVRLLKLVNTLLDFSRIEAGRVQAMYEPTDLASVTADISSVFRSAVEKAGLTFVIDCPPLSESAYVDRDMWEKIVLNLISNAFKFTFKGTIEVKLRETSNHIQLTVLDTGTGISVAELPKLFERFHRVAGAQGRTHEGSGIGLALVQELVKLHGGTVSVQSIEGQGSTFTVTIPRGRSHLPAGQISAARAQGSTSLGATPFVQEALRWLPDDKSQDEQVIADMELTDAVGNGEERARVLLADDNADMRDYVSRLLATRYEVEAVADGEAALAAISRSQPALVLSDVMMPRLDGLELLARLRADPLTSTIPVILLSARAGEESRIEGMHAGADDYLVKPFSARELLARVSSGLQLARLRRDAEQKVRESEARLAAEGEALARLNKASSRLWQQQQLAGGLQEMLDATIALLGADMGNIQLLDPKSHVLSIAVQRGFKQPFLDVFREVSTDDDAACGRALRSGTRTIIPDVDADEPFAPFREVAREAGFRGVQSTPLIARDGTPLGMISTHWRRVHSPTEQDLRRLDLYARQAADFIERARVEDALRESEKRFRHMADSAPVMVWVTEPDGSCSFLSQSWYDFTGQTPATGLGMGWLDATHPDDRPAATETFLGANAAQDAFRLEYRLRRRDGEYRWAIDAATPRLSESGQFLGYIGSVIDITERKQAEQTQDLLVNELNHRVKNTLAVVQSIVQQTLRRTKDPVQFGESFGGRIRSLARVHSLLSAATWQGADLRELIRDQLLDGHPTRPESPAWGPPVRLEAQMALHVAMMLHELGTNASKYGALSGSTGWVTVGWTIEDGTLRLRWQERGGPPAIFPTKTGFGTTLIEQSTKGQGGNARLSASADGIIWDIELPLPTPPAPPSRVTDMLKSEPSRLALEVAQRSSGKLAGKRFLIVEDEPLVALDTASGPGRSGR